jgi:hypothetical protein
MNGSAHARAVFAMGSDRGESSCWVMERIGARNIAELAHCDEGSGKATGLIGFRSRLW